MLIAAGTVVAVSAAYVSLHDSRPSTGTDWDALLAAAGSIEQRIAHARRYVAAAERLPDASDVQEHAPRFVESLRGWRDAGLLDGVAPDELDRWFVCADRVAVRTPEVESILVHAMVEHALGMHGRGRTEAAAELLLESYRRHLCAPTPWREFALRSAIELLVSSGSPERAEQLLEAADAVEPAGGRGPGAAAHLAAAEVQVHLALGRLNPAARALSRIAGDDPSVRYLRIVREADVELAAARFATVRERIESALDEVGWPRELASVLCLYAGVAAHMEADSGAARALIDRALRLGLPGAEYVDRARRTLAELDGSLPDDAPLDDAAWCTLASKLLLARGDASPVELAEQAERQWLAAEAEIEHWSALPRSVENVGPLHHQEPRCVIGEYLALSIECGDAQRAFEFLLRAQRLGATSRDVPSCELVDVREHLTGAAGGVLAYLPMPSGILLFVVDSERCSPYVLAPEFDVKQQVRRHLALLARFTSGTADAGAAAPLESSSRSLAETLLPPAALERVLRWNHVHVSGASLLLGLPFETLCLPDGTLLGERIACSTLASLPLGIAAVREHRTPRRLRVALCGALRPGRDRLAADRHSASVLHPQDFAALARVLEPVGHIVESFVENRCSESVLLDALGSADATQILAHGTRRDVPGLLLEEGSVFDADDLAGHTTRGLVLITACESFGGTPLAGNDDLAGHLGGALLAAGADTVIASRATLRLEPQLAFSKEFWTAIGCGVPPAEALRRARVAAADGEQRGRVELALVQLFGIGHLPRVER